MSNVDPTVDLAGLARRVEPPPVRRRAVWLVPLALAAGFAWVLADTLREQFLGETEVTVVRPEVAVDDGSGVRAGRPDRPVVQAAGWIEPDPFPTHASALAAGVVREVLVQESDEVVAGQPVAELVDDEARLAVDAARARVASAEAALASSRARADIARERFEAALEVTEAAERARARLVARRAETDHRLAAVAEGEAVVSLATSEVIVQRDLTERGAAGPRQVEIAEAELAVANARLEILRAAAATAQADADEAAAADARARADLEHRFADRLERDVARAEAERAEGALAEARAELAAADLALARMIVRAPAAGVVLERLVAPGMGLAAGDAACSLWDPRAVRVRVDVPQGDLGKLFHGQRAEILSESRAGRPYRGEVVRIVQQADIQKVTLEAQVRVEDADGLLRPDMLVQVRFIGARRQDGQAPEDAELGDVVLVPQSLVEAGAVWVVDADARARRRRVELGDARGERVEVLAGLTLADKVIDGGRDGLTEGARVRVGGPR